MIIDSVLLKHQIVLSVCFPSRLQALPVICKESKSLSDSFAHCAFSERSASTLLWLLTTCENAFKKYSVPRVLFSVC